MNLTASTLPSGTTIGSYRVDRVLAEGELATVYEAAHVALPRRAALKLLRAEIAGNARAAQRIVREAHVLEAFAHPGVVRVFDCGFLPDGRSWSAMELVGGEPLTTTFARIEPMSLDAVIALTTGLVEIIASAHRSGIVHRDLKASHVMVSGSAASDVRLLGWGHAHQPGGGHDLIGERQADVLAIGALAYQAATGQAPFPAARLVRQATRPLPQPLPVRMLRPEVTTWLASLIEAMLAAAPLARPSAPAIGDELMRLDDTPYAGFALATDGPEAIRAAEPTQPVAQDDRDWASLVAMDAAKRPWSASRRPPRLGMQHDEPRPRPPGSTTRPDHDATTSELTGERGRSK